MKQYRLLFSIICIILFSGSCKKNDTTAINLATLTTKAMNSITNTTVYSGGDISSDGGAEITSRGVCWSTLNNPTIADAHKTNGAGIGKYASNIYGLTANTTYYVRAFATNAVGTAYGNEISFTTLNTTPSVYVVGEDYTGVAGKRYARLWKDGVAINLSSGNDTTTANSVFVSGNDVYVAGTKSKNYLPNTFEAMFWKNGVATNLVGASTFSSMANAICVSGNDVYIAGQIDSAYGPIGKVTYWKNGTATFLSTNKILNTAKSIFVEGTDVYVAGKIGNGTYSDAIFWKNGIAKYLYEGDANSIYVYENDVYVGGKKDTDVSNYDYLAFSKNGVLIPLVATNINSISNAVFVAGEDVYVAGSLRNPGYNYHISKIWKNGTETSFPQVVNSFTCVTSIFVYSTDVYVAGYVYLNSTTTATSARLWKNGVSIPLPNGGINSRALSVFVK